MTDILYEILRERERKMTMTDTNNLREQVAQAIYAWEFTEPFDTGWHVNRDMSYDRADAALAVAEPIIRAQVIAELAAIAERFRLDVRHRPTNGEIDTLADWLRAQE